MFPILLVLFSLLPQEPGTVVLAQRGIRNPALSPAGRIVYELDGDLWVADVQFHSTHLYRDNNVQSVPEIGVPKRVTSGPAWDRQPAWTPDGRAIVFSSDRNGTVDLWSARLNEDGGAEQLRALTSSPEIEGEPNVDADGTIVFVRGSDQTADLWLRFPDGRESNLTTAPGGELSPVFSPDGGSVAYVAVNGSGRQLRVRYLDAGRDELVVADAAVEHPAWSPDGEKLAFATRSAKRGVWVTPRDGAYVNLLTEQAATASWSRDGNWLVLASLPHTDLGYNGDPQRLSSMPGREALMNEGTLSVIPVPPLPGSNPVQLPVAAPVQRSERYAQAFDRFWERMDDLYYERSGGAAWHRMRSQYRPRALRAISDSALDELIYEILRRRPPLRDEVRGSAAVSSAHELASAAGAEMLRRGGNVVDAAVATSFAIGVVEPDASGVGGYGEMVLYLNGMEEPVVIEFLTRVPEQAGLDNGALLVDGRLPVDGPVLANVPGTVAGMRKAWEDYGSGNLDWAELLQPSIRLAESGFALDNAFPTTLARERNRFAKYESSMRLFFPDGQPLQPGDTLKNPDLAWTLRQIADGGADAFYRGEIAKRMVADLRGLGNAMTMHDMARYFAVEREPIRGTYHGHTVYSSAPAASGGVSLVTKLNLLEHTRSSGLYRDHAATLHAMIEAWKLTPSTAGRLADPSLWPVDLEPVLDRNKARATWQHCFDPDRATGPEDLRRTSDGDPVCANEYEVGFSWGESPQDCDVADDPHCRATGTTAFTVADGDGDIVAVTQTLGTWGGNFYVTPGLGFIYNDKLRSYRTDPEAYGARLPYARNGTSIAPTLVFAGTGSEQRPSFAVAAAGNAWITSAVYQVLVAMVDHGLGPQDALELPRFLVRSGRGNGSGREVMVQLEDGFSSDVIRGLSRLGHDYQLVSLLGELRMGYGAAVLIDGDMVLAGGDPRRSGGAVAVR